MIEDAWDDGAQLQADICVVGAGAAGLALAHGLAPSRPRVVLLESGGVRRGDEHDDLNRGESAAAPLEGLAGGRVRALGGTTTVWAGQCIPLDPLDLERRDWVPHSGWPFGLAELEPYFRRAEAFLGIPGALYDERNYAPFGVTPLDLAPEDLRTVFTVMIPRANLGRRLHRALRTADDIRVLLDATAIEVRTNAAGSHVECLRFKSLDGRRGQVVARSYVICAGGVENARLLLASDAADPAGVGNGHDLVGRFFQEHPNAMTADVDAVRPLAIQERFSLLYRRGVRYFPKLALTAEHQRARQTLNAVAWPVYDFGEAALSSARVVSRALRRGERPPQLRRHLRRLAGGVDELAAAAVRRYATGRSPAARPVAIGLQVQVEQAPYPDSRVTLSDERDQLGMRRARVDWRLGELERRTARELTSSIRTALQQRGLARVDPYAWLDDDDVLTRALGDSYHHIGTTRMAQHPSEGVVDASCRVHGLDNLFVAGSSVFPTSGFANPTLTIVALALRLADHLAATELASPARPVRLAGAATHGNVPARRRQ